MYISDPELVQAPSLLNPSPSDTLMLLIPYCSRLDKDYRMAPVAKSCNRISPEVEDEAIIYSQFTHPKEVIPPECPFSLCRSCLSLLVDFISHILTVLFADPAPIYLDLGENRQQFMEDGYSDAL